MKLNPLKPEEIYELRQVSRIRAEENAKALWSPVSRSLTFVVVFAILMIAVIGPLSNRYWRDIDVTDLSPTQRSGLSVHTDYGTGCLYLRAPSGSLTPRMVPHSGTTVHDCTGERRP